MRTRPTRERRGAFDSKVYRVPHRSQNDSVRISVIGPPGEQDKTPETHVGQGQSIPTGLQAP